MNTRIQFTAKVEQRKIIIPDEYISMVGDVRLQTFLDEQALLDEE